MFGHYLKVAWRNLLKYKVQSVISMIGLGIGLSCFTLCNRNIREIFMNDRRLPYLNSTYVLYSEGRESGIPDLVPAKIAEKLAEEFPEIEKSVIYYSLGEYSQKTCVVEHEDGSNFRMFVVEISLIMMIVLLLSLVFTEVLTQIIRQTSFRYIFFYRDANLMWELGRHALQYTILIWGVMILICWFTLKRMKLFSMYNRLQGGELHYKSKIQNVLLGIQLSICIFLPAELISCMLSRTFWKNGLPVN